MATVLTRLHAQAVTVETIEFSVGAAFAVVDLAEVSGRAGPACGRALRATVAGALRAVAGFGAALPVRGACDPVAPEFDVVSAIAIPGELNRAHPKISAVVMMPMRATYLACTMGAPRGDRLTDACAESVTPAGWRVGFL
ncbi:hypothetical protein MHPYR_170017 [uncultured Mycobacterium sp.]|uniref:Uncharacterized protein n=1 Tax=uncultured Mycobacterium sp. TaxID=171292 RepID=A0A1Y5P442_9MYCO|nr:hypothetical protein MHPYR_170017 [uncultured Mycobacterium sp.]